MLAGAAITVVSLGGAVVDACWCRHGRLGLHPLKHRRVRWRVPKDHGIFHDRLVASA